MVRALFNSAAALAALASFVVASADAQPPPPDINHLRNDAWGGMVRLTVPAGSDSHARDQMTAAVATYRQFVQDGPARTASVALGQAVAEQVLAARSNAGANAPDPSQSHNQITIVPDSELELLGVSVDHKTWEAPDGTIYQCNGGFYAIRVKGQGTIWCNGKEL